MVLLPYLFGSNTALNFLNQICITTVLALSFNLLLGQTGLLSFGHAVYSGVGAFAAIHALNQISAHQFPFPVSLVPLVAGLAGLIAGIVFGWLSSKRAGLTFSMISLGIGELMYTGAAMFPQIFGGEGGISANRVIGAEFLGISFGPQIELSYLIIGWTLIAAMCMYYLTLTPLGKLACAVRDNAERVAFLGYDPRWIRFLMLCCSGFFAGIAGGLSALHFELASTDNFSIARSGSILLFSYIGGVSLFLGPIVGAVLAVTIAVFLSDMTPAWQLYVGVLFMSVVSFAPQGISGLIMTWLFTLKHAAAQLQLRRFFVKSLRFAGSISLCCSGLILVIELVYRLRFSSEGFHPIILFNRHIDPHHSSSWLMALAIFIVGIMIKPPKSSSHHAHAPT